MEENRQIMRALATAMNRIDQMYLRHASGIGAGRRRAVGLGCTP